MAIIYSISAPQTTDFERLLMIWEESVRATHYFLTEDKIQLFKTMIVEHKLFQKSDMFCVRDSSGEVAGFAGITGDSLDMLFLGPAAIGTGAGKALIRYAIDVKGVKRVDVNEQNPKARGFYEHFGFEVAGRSETDDNGEPFPLLHMILNQPTSIRTVENNEIVLLQTICKQTYAETFLEAFNDPEAFETYTQSQFALERLQIELTDPGCQFYFALKGQKVAGYLKLIVNDSIEIEHIYVLAAFQGQGIGKALLDHTIAIAKTKAMKLVWLAVWENNAKAIHFYKRYGFEQFDAHHYEIAGDPQTDLLLRFPILA